MKFAKSIDPVFVINPWFEGRLEPQIVRKSEINFVRLIDLGKEDSWIEVVTKSGEKLTTELGKYQDLRFLLNDLHNNSVRIMRLSPA